MEVSSSSPVPCRGGFILLGLDFSHPSNSFLKLKPIICFFYYNYKNCFIALRYRRGLKHNIENRIFIMVRFNMFLIPNNIRKMTVPKLSFRSKMMHSPAPWMNEDGFAAACFQEGECALCLVSSRLRLPWNIF